MFSLIHKLQTVQWLGWNISSSFPGDFFRRQPSTVVTTDEWQQVLGLGKNEDFRELDVGYFVVWAAAFWKTAAKTGVLCWGQDAFVCRLKRKAGVPRLTPLWSCWMSSEIGFFKGFLARYLQISEMRNKNPLVSTCFNSSRKRGPTYFWLTEFVLIRQKL